MIKNTKLLVLIGSIATLFLGLVLVRILTYQAKPSETPRPSINQINMPTISPRASSTLLPSSMPGSIYEQNQLDKDFNRIVNPKELSTTDIQIRNNLIRSLQDKSGILHQDSGYKIEYVKSPDTFMVEILVSDAEIAKTDAIAWFQEKGLSDNGICNLPVEFFLSFDVIQIYRESNQKFNPVPKICE